MKIISHGTGRCKSWKSNNVITTTVRTLYGQIVDEKVSTTQIGISREIYYIIYNNGKRVTMNSGIAQTIDGYYSPINYIKQQLLRNAFYI